uniref:ELYS-like domain-containing protein n=1 Tax=Globisporangium ultimum (strain ATCC 200006 / CBS 805.95 / DAOM BR144) TaxID=431595 RepID=K3WH28_GLOUD
MLVPVFERFAECGWQLFVEPAETYEFFTVSGVFKRARIDAKLHGVQQHDAERLVQRNALFDLCLVSGLAHIIVAYVRAEDKSGRALPRDSSASPSLIGLEPKDYVLKEPIAVQQWARRRLETIEQFVNEIVAEHHFAADRKESSQRELAAHVRELNGLRAIAMALVERLKEGSRQVSQLAHGHNAMRAGLGSSTGAPRSLEETELSRLTRAGIQNLLELLGRIQTVASACQCMLWLEENQIHVDEQVYEDFYKGARAIRATYWDQFKENYGSLVSSVSIARGSDPLLLIEDVMQSANIAMSDLGGSSPPRQLGQLLQLLKSSAIQEDVISYYSDEMDCEPIESYFRVQVALLMYFCLDRTYLSELSQQVHTGVRIAHKMRAMADSFAAQLNVRDDMKLTLLALWLIENAVVVNTGNHDHVAAIYESAVSLLQQSSAMHLHQKYDLEPQLILHVIETLVHRGESLVAWKVWNTFGVDLAQSPPTATELAVVVSLELDMWERALTLLRSQKRGDLLELVISWLVKSNRVKELVQSVTLLPNEETMFHLYMLNAGIFLAEDALRDENIKRVDMLTMYYVLRNKYEKAWEVHNKHLAIIRGCTSGDTQIATTVLNQPSFRVRAALLENMCPEPTPKQQKFRHADGEDVAMEGGDDREKKALPRSSSVERISAAINRENAPMTPRKNGSDAPTRPTEYSPGIYSSRASLPRSSSAKKRPVNASEAPSTPLQGSRSASTIPNIGSVDSTPDVRCSALPRRHSFDESTRSSAVQSLQFGSTPVIDLASVFQAQKQATEEAFTERRPVNQPLRSRFNRNFVSSTPMVQNPGGVSTDDLTLKPRAFDSHLDDSKPVDVQIAARRSVLDTASIPASSTSSTHSSEAILETPKRFQFVREPMTDSRIGMLSRELVKSPATAELEEMELERIDEEFSTPMSRSRGRRTEVTSVPERRNPRRSARKKY